MKKITTILIILTAIFAACKESSPVTVTTDPNDDIREAVFRYQFEHNESGLQQTANYYFIGLHNPGDSIFYRDLSDSFLSRFSGNIPPVKKVSQCDESFNGVFDKDTGERGLIFRIESITFQSDEEVEVRGGYFEGGLSASGNIYTVKKVQGVWQVTKDELQWIS